MKTTRYICLILAKLLGVLALGSTAAAQLFGPEQIIVDSPAGLRPWHVRAADIDGDGDQDVVLANGGAGLGLWAINWYENLGGGAFLPHWIGTLRSPRSIDTGDIDGDGDPDVAVAAYGDYPYGSEGIFWFENDGNPNAWPGHAVSYRLHATWVRAADLDGDDDLDLLYSDYDGDAYLSFNAGDGSWSSHQQIANLAYGTTRVEPADVDGDGDLDVLYSCTGQDQILWIENLDGATFGSPRTIAAPAGGPSSIYPADLDEDGDTDLVSASDSLGELTWFENIDGLGSFSGGQTISSSIIWPKYVYATDLDGDTDVDVLSASDWDHKVAWYENLGGGSFGPQQVVSSGAYTYPSSVHAADLDGDLDPDILASHWNSDLVTWYENGPATFCELQTDPDIALCDDFTDPAAIDDYLVTTPWASGQNAMDVFVDSGALVFRTLSGWSDAVASHGQTFNFEDSAFEADVRLESGGPGGFGLEWVGDPQNRFQASLDTGADTVSIDVLVNDAWLPSVAASMALDPYVTYRLRMEVVGADRIKIYVDGVLVIEAPMDLTAIPRLAHPSFAGFTHNAGDMLFDDMLVYTTNHAPLADAGADQSVDEGTMWVQLDGSGSHDPDGDAIQNWSWSQIAGTSVALDEADPARPTLTAPCVPVGGETLTFELVVGDGELLSDPTLTNVCVKNVNNPPVADAGPPQSVQEGAPVTLDGTGSYDEDAEPLTFAWTQLQGWAVSLSDPTNPQPEFTAPLVGAAGETLIFELLVNDGIDDSDPATVTILVENVNHPPVAEAGDPQTIDELTTVWLDASGSSDPDQDPLSHEWTQVDGTYVTLSDPFASNPWFVAPVVYATSEDLEFEVRACDPFVCDTDTVVVTVLNTNSPPDCTLARASVSSLWPPNHKMVSVSVLGVFDPDDDSVVITVTGVTQDEPVDGTGSGDTAPDAVLQGDTVLLRAERSGSGNGRVYVVSFEADDGQGDVCSGTITVCVPHKKRSTSCPDDGQVFDSTQL